jgi:hypothetical protein
MEFWITVLKVLDARMPEPPLYGWFHWLCLALTAVATVVLCFRHKRHNEDRVRHIITWTTLAVIVLEVYKQVNYGFSYEAGTITFDYVWHAFPFQFCSTPMYVGLLAGLTHNGKIHRAAYSYLATYSMFAGLCVMLYPSTVFGDVIGMNIQTMICHGSMIVLGVYLMYTGYVKMQHRTVLRALPIFASCVGIAMILNEIAYRSGLLERERFNMFLISPYSHPELPVYSIVQENVAYPWCLVIYIAMFTLAAYLVLLVSMAIKHAVLMHMIHKRRRLKKAGKK